jgi:hypothetical protein
MNDLNELEATYGVPAKYADHAIGARIRYRLVGQEFSGEIIYIVAPSTTVSGAPLPTLYVVMRDETGDTMPDLVAPGEIVA